mmetsp:Transcript_44962/g.109724  ORF Transcript_44962/g.109724 Transcript_44962/m.109724 type:complete len:289 (-) Transcript_44962:548-1414(-)
MLRNLLRALEREDDHEEGVLCHEADLHAMSPRSHLLQFEGEKRDLTGGLHARTPSVDAFSLSSNTRRSTYSTNTAGGVSPKTSPSSLSPSAAPASFMVSPISSLAPPTPVAASFATVHALARLRLEVKKLRWGVPEGRAIVEAMQAADEAALADANAAERCVGKSRICVSFCSQSMPASASRPSLSPPPAPRPASAPRGPVCVRQASARSEARRVVSLPCVWVCACARSPRLPPYPVGRVSAPRVPEAPPGGRGAPPRQTGGLASARVRREGRACGAGAGASEGPEDP